MWYVNWSSTSAETRSGGGGVLRDAGINAYGLFCGDVCDCGRLFVVFFLFYEKWRETLSYESHFQSANSESRLMPCSPSNTRSRSCGQSSMIMPLFRHEPAKASRRLQISDMSYVIDHPLPLLQVIGNVMR